MRMNFKLLPLWFAFITIFLSCFNNEYDLAKVQEQKTKDSISYIDSLRRANENKYLVDSLLNVGLPDSRKNQEFLNREIANVNVETNRIENGRISFSSAEKFMQNELKSAGQFIISEIITDFNGTKIYMFLSTGVGNVFCISGVSENALEVLSSDCGDESVKMRQWRDLISAGNCQVIK